MTAPRTGLAVILTIVLFAAPLAAEAPPAQRVYRIGVLHPGFAPNHPAAEGLKAGLKTLGLEEGRDVSFDIRFTSGNLEALPATAEALVRAGVDLIFTSAEPQTRAARAATRSIPIVFTLVGNPVAEGIVQELARPGGNITGVSSLSTELAPKRLEILKMLVPAMRRVWAIYPAGDPTWAAAARTARRAAPALQIELVDRPVRTVEEVTQALEALRPGDGLLPPVGTAFDIPGQIWYRSARVPAIFTSAFWVRQGALASYGSDFHAEGVQAARLVVKILRGARTQDLPVEGANRIELAINLKTARALGLTIPPSVLLRADQVIE